MLNKMTIELWVSDEKAEELRVSMGSVVEFKGMRIAVKTFKQNRLDHLDDRAKIEAQEVTFPAQEGEASTRLKRAESQVRLLKASYNYIACDGSLARLMSDFAEQEIALEMTQIEYKTGQGYPNAPTVTASGYGITDSLEPVSRKPFDLSKALAGAKVVTRTGMDVTGLHIFKGSGSSKTLYGVVRKEIANWNCLGKVFDDASSISGDDLFLASEKREGWINVYEISVSTGAYLCSQVYPDKKTADEEPWNGKVVARAVHVEWSA